MTMKSKPSRAAISVSILVCLLVLVSTIPIGAVAQSGGETEPNDARLAATPLEGSINGEIVRKGGIDWYSAEFTKGETVSFLLTKTASEPGLNVTLYAPNGSQITRDSAFDGIGRAKVMTTATQTGTYYVRVKAVQTSSSGIPYTIYTPAEAAPAKKTPKSTSIAGSQQASEPNDKRKNADPIKAEQISGALNSGNDTDWYEFQATNGSKVSVLITKPAKAPGLVLRFYPPDSDYDIILEKIKKGDTRVQVVIPAKRSGTYSMSIYAQIAGEIPAPNGGYTIQIFGQAPPLQTTPSTITTTLTQTTTATSQMTTTSTSVTTTGTKASTQTSTSASTDTTASANTQDTPVEEETTSMFGPGFTSVGAIVALLSAALFTIRRQ